jgi:hypothetical protein
MRTSNFHCTIRKKWKNINNHINCPIQYFKFLPEDFEHRLLIVESESCQYTCPTEQTLTCLFVHYKNGFAAAHIGSLLTDGRYPGGFLQVWPFFTAENCREIKCHKSGRERFQSGRKVQVGTSEQKMIFTKNKEQKLSTL